MEVGEDGKEEGGDNKPDDDNDGDAGAGMCSNTIVHVNPNYDPS